MRNAILLLTFLIALCSCSERNGKTGLEPLARGLAEAWQPVAHDMKLDIRPENRWQLCDFPLCPPESFCKRN